MLKRIHHKNKFKNTIWRCYQKIISDFEDDFGEASTYNNIKDINREFKNN